MTIIDVDIMETPYWEELLTKYHSDLFHSPPWLAVLEKTYGFQLRARLLLDEKKQVVAGIPYSCIHDMMDPRIVSLPFSDFCDPLVDSPERWELLLASLMKENLPISMRCLHNQIPLNDAHMPTVYQAYWHCLDLTTDDETRWQTLASSARRAVRKAEQSGVVVKVANDKRDLRTFFELHLRVRKQKYNLVAQPYAFFENIWDNFVATGNGALIVATLDEKIVGGVFFLVWNNRFYYKFNASNFDTIQHRPNDLVVWEASKYGHKQGYDYLDFGLSDADQEGLVRYKRKFASTEKRTSFIRYTPAHALSTGTKQMRGLLPQLTNLFVDAAIPDQITEKAGEILYRYFT